MKFKISYTCLLFFMKISLLHSLLFLINACGETKSDDKSSEKLNFTEQKNFVEIIILQKGNFQKELVSNGKLKALTKSDMKFIVSGQLKQLLAINGQHVQAGQAIAALEQFEYKQKQDQAQTALNTANIELEDLLIARGYYLQDSNKIPHDTYKMLLVRSGRRAAERDLRTTDHNLQGTILKAPFQGKIANLKHKKYEQVNSGEIFCTIIDDSEFEVEFNLVETEIKDVKLNDEVSVVPFSIELSIKGYVSEINPVIDEHGLVLVKARVKNRDGQLMEGMNVKVSAKKNIANKLVIPKSAIVLRQNQEVLFKYSHGKAIWTYVQTDLENGDSYSAKAHAEKGGSLEPGDTIIVSGNLNLAHESMVEIKNSTGSE